MSIESIWDLPSEERSRALEAAPGYPRIVCSVSKVCMVFNQEQESWYLDRGYQISARHAATVARLRHSIEEWRAAQQAYRLREERAAIEAVKAKRRRRAAKRRQKMNRPGLLPGDANLRDVWMTFVPGPDPRLDWQIPTRSVSTETRH